MGITGIHSFLFLVIIFLCSTERRDENGAPLETTAYVWLESINLPGYHREAALGQCTYVCLCACERQGRKGGREREGERERAEMGGGETEIVKLFSCGLTLT